MQNGKISEGDILPIFFKIGDRGDIIIYKNDGVRESQKFTVILLSGANKFDAIRVDADTLLEAVEIAVNRYRQYEEFSF